ncbi:MAG: hypothetical protein NVS2B9_11750 [Myxococcales bacterium]
MDDLLATFREQAPRVRAIAFRILHDKSDAEDVMQETFAAAWRLSPNYDPARGSTLHWLGCMARSRAIDRLRVRQVHQRTLERLPTACPPLEPEQEAGTRERARLKAALALLPLQQRKAVELAYVAGFSHQGIAAVMASPVGTVKTRLRLGLQRLAALLSDE